MTVAQAKGTQGKADAVADARPAVQSDAIGDILADAILQESQGTQEPIEEEILDDPEDTEDEEEHDEEEASEDEDTDDSEEDAGSSDTEEPDPKLVRWADGLRQNPKRLTQIPQEQRVEAIALALQRASAAAVQEWQQAGEETFPKLLQQAYQKGYEEARQSVESASEFTAMETMEEEDPQAFYDLIRKDRAKARRYFQWKETGETERETGVNSELRSEVESMRERVKGNPVALGFLQENLKGNPNLYQFDAVGSARFLRDAQAALDRAEREAAQKEQEARAEAQRRQRAAEKRKSLPKPDSEHGKHRPPQPVGSVSDLIAAGWAEKG